MIAAQYPDAALPPEPPAPAVPELELPVLLELLDASEPPLPPVSVDAGSLQPNAKMEVEESKKPTRRMPVLVISR
jgi:hypothetical protein